MKYKFLENTVKGFDNHWRIKILELLEKKPELSLFDIADELKMNIKTASVHVKRLVSSGLVYKNYISNKQSHVINKRGKSILTFLRKLE